MSEEIKVSSSNQTGGVTAGKVTIHSGSGQKPQAESAKPSAPKKLGGWQIVVRLALVLGAVASLIAIWEFLKKPAEKPTAGNPSTNNGQITTGNGNIIMGDIHVTSNSQSGGITAGIVNIGQPVRTMNESLAKDLKAQIPLDSIVHVSAISDGEAQQFAQVIVNWLRDNGYDRTKIAGPGLAITAERLVGIELSVGMVPPGVKGYSLTVGAAK